MMLSSKFSVGRYVCEMSWSQFGYIKCEWSPEVPTALGKQEIREYRAGRDSFVQNVAESVGGNVLVVEART
ncbi:hypothetical protein RX330_20330 [Bradyrhizobium sp. NDS-1]|uniref:hypothetical protein n=1 Tax=Bradyrhizobium sp. NDS-1 TaxID=3080014 RepID=UPI00293F0E56|nr:hypothetical protein [Bradyrhizobium sp. NDS-1]WOH70647.1 hypothetical protein RX330_20330 [Bradyrhizobium sp. NDS-1]